jgi:hypothetical protein
VVVRARSRERLARLARDCGAEERIHPLVGDVTLADLGLSRDDVSVLRSRIDHFVHVAAACDWSADEEAAEARRAEEFGVRCGPVTVDWSAVQQRMRRLREEISRHDSAERFRSLGVDVFLGEGRFVGPDAIAVAGQTLSFARAVIATGGRSAVPDVPSLDRAAILTSETVWDLPALPRRLIVLGGGPMGCELAQVFRRFGSEVHLIQRDAVDEDRADPIVNQAVGDALRALTRRPFDRHLPAAHPLQPLCRLVHPEKPPLATRARVHGRLDGLHVALEFVLRRLGEFRAKVETRGREQAGKRDGDDARSHGCLTPGFESAMNGSPITRRYADC